MTADDYDTLSGQVRRLAAKIDALCAELDETLNPGSAPRPGDAAATRDFCGKGPVGGVTTPAGPASSASFPSTGVSSNAGDTPTSFQRLAAVKARVESGWYDRHPEVMDIVADRLAADLERSCPPVRGGQGRSARDITDSGYVMSWLAVGVFIAAFWALVYNLIT